MKYCRIDKHIKLLNLVLFVLRKVEVEGRILNATISVIRGKYFVSILVETEVQELPKTDSTVGIDVGLKILLFFRMELSTLI